MKLYFYENGVKVGVSSRAFDVIEEKELMRAWLLTFGIDNKNPMRKYVKPGVQFEIGGQLFDIYSFRQSSGAQNTTAVTAYHVSYRLNNYIVPPGYSFGPATSGAILANLLAEAKTIDGIPASSEFTVGTTANIGTIAFSLENEQEVSLRSALLGLQGIGLEVDYNNFSINLPARIGAETGRTFKFGVDLVSLDRTWSTDDGATYDINAASIGRLPGASPGEQYALGDNVLVEDAIIGDTISRRIVRIEKCHDNPAKDRLTLGVFIRDSATNAIQMQAEIDMKITEGEEYNNVKINRLEGFVAERDDGAAKIMMNALDGLVIKDGSGRIIGGLRIIGGKVYMVSSAVMNPESSGHYFYVGTGPGGYPGAAFVNDSGEYLGIWPDVSQRAHLNFVNGGNIECGGNLAIYLDSAMTRLQFGDNSAVDLTGTVVRIGFGTQNALTFNNSGMTVTKGGILYDGITRTLNPGERPIFVNGICRGYTT